MTTLSDEELHEISKDHEKQARQHPIGRYFFLLSTLKKRLLVGVCVRAMAVALEAD